MEFLDGAGLGYKLSNADVDALLKLGKVEYEERINNGQFVSSEVGKLREEIKALGDKFVVPVAVGLAIGDCKNLAAHPTLLFQVLTSRD